MTTELVHFKLFRMPCCGHLLCWVNPRFPSYCPECGVHVYPSIRDPQHLFASSEKAQLKY